MAQRFLIFSFTWLLLIIGCSSATSTPTKLAAPARTKSTNKERIFYLPDLGREADHLKRLYLELKKDKTSTTFRTIGVLEIDQGQGYCTTRYNRSTRTWAIEASGSWGHSPTPDTFFQHAIYKNVTDKILFKSLAPLVKREWQSDGYFMADFDHNLRTNGAQRVFSVGGGI